MTTSKVSFRTATDATDDIELVDIPDELVRRVGVDHHGDVEGVIPRATEVLFVFVLIDADDQTEAGRPTGHGPRKQTKPKHNDAKCAHHVNPYPLAVSGIEACLIASATKRIDRDTNWSVRIGAAGRYTRRLKTTRTTTPSVSRYWMMAS